MPYRLNKNAGIDVLHLEHPWESCNQDDAQDSETVDDETAAALIAIGEARSCEHCQPFPETS